MADRTTAAPGTREYVYDTQMAALVDQLAAIAQANGIPLFVHASLDGDEHGRTHVTTSLSSMGDDHERRRWGWLVNVASDPKWSHVVRMRAIEWVGAVTAADFAAPGVADA